MAPLPNPQKTPKQKRHFSHGSGSISLVLPRPGGGAEADSFHGSSFTEHRSPADIPDTPLHEPRDQHDPRGEVGNMEGNGADVSNSSSSSSSNAGFAANINSVASSTAPLSRSKLSFNSSGKPQLGQQPPMLSPWQHFAATGGAMTPSVEKPGGEAISPFFAMGMLGGGDGNGQQVPSNPPGFPGFNMTLPSSSSTSKPPGYPTPTFAASPRSNSPHLGGPFEQLNLDGAASSGLNGTSTPGIASASMQDPFMSAPVTSSTPRSATIPGTETGHLDALAATLAARRRGSRSGPSGLSNVHAGDASSQSQSQTPGTPDGDATPRVQTASTSAPSGPVASGLRPKLPSGSVSGVRKSPLGASSTAGNTTPLVSSASGKAFQSSTSSNSSILDALSPSELASYMHDSSAGLLILDLRQPSAYVTGHAAHAVPLPIPSTLLKRQAFTLDKLQDMLPSRAAKAITNWRDNANVVIIDQDSTTANPGSVINGVANKFRSAAEPNGENVWSGKIWFLKGGMMAVKNTPEVDMEYGNGDEDAAEQQSQGFGAPNGQVTPGAQDLITADQSASASPGSSDTAGRAVNVFGNLSRAAFQQGAKPSPPASGSTRGMARRRANAPGSIAMPTATGPLRLDLRGTGFSKSTNNGARTSTRDVSDAPLDTGALNVTAGADTSRPRAASPHTEESSGETLQPANPFFDNIRQNLELSHGGITERINLNLPPEIESRSHELPAFLRDLVEKPRDETAAILAHEFENVERDEQKRLQSIMEWHSRGMKHIDEVHKSTKRHRKRERQRKASGLTGDHVATEENATGVSKIVRVQRTSSGMVQVKGVDPKESADSPDDYFPFSITAGVERGAKNRYKNIWPYDFSRVRLGVKSHDDGSDYINANFILPKGTNKRYIATQGPLDATFEDFWTLVWEQRVEVIVMLTKQFEGGAVKCGSYWTDGTYGPLHLQLLSIAGGEDEQEKAVSGFNFHVGSDRSVTSAPNIHRVFLLTHDGHPDSPPRKITQIQCVSWPDFDVPDDPHTLLGLVKEVDQASEEMAADADDREQKPPVIVHCSAGVGRTGSYIVVDAMLDALRREHHTHHRKIRGTSLGLSRRRQSRQSEQALLSTEALNRLYDRRESAGSSSDISAGSPLSPPVQEAGSSPSAFVPFPALQSFTFSPPIQGAGERMDVDHLPTSESLQGGQMGRISEEVNDKEPREYDLVNEIETIPKITARNKDVAGDPSPILEKPQPVQAILGNMRVQRMSLCQSLRQYLFVYRGMSADLFSYLAMLTVLPSRTAIIIGYLDMLDEEKEIEQELHTNVTSPSTLPSRTANHSAATTDEESQSKRRAPDFQLVGSSLTKRPSVKSFGGKRRPRNNSGSDESRLSTSSNPIPSPSGGGSAAFSYPATTTADVRAPRSANSLDLIEEPLQDSMIEGPTQEHKTPHDFGIHDMDTS
ncbi:hypothetical protein QFC21_005360 [Naganishia friedmannii]|uniref:Uncharacterized protein n=1 Tax=Naganishia friedmannii TaxID=89922 RepID=A0ACC2VAJ9_9TREE|nr:hypothetical protein QFC21_005360 [Naganishia friedmannii]